MGGEAHLKIVLHGKTNGNTDCTKNKECNRHACKCRITDRSLVCEKFVALHPREIKPSSYLADKVSKVLLLASRFLFWGFQEFAVTQYTLQFVVSKSPCLGANVGQLKIK